MPDHHDVIIVGAGLSGISAAVHIKKDLPQKQIVILDKRDAIGGTWDLFRYPGVRSDSDMYTLGFDFKPWENNKAIADGESIREYIVAAAGEYGVDRDIRFGHRVVEAAWDTDSARWTVTCELGDGERTELTANYVHFGSGYYNYEDPFRPQLPGEENFGGEIIHPQHWPEDLDYAGKRIVVIGSGATAMTLVPSLAKTAEHVTLLQRSPTYVIALPAEEDLANNLRKVLPSKVAYRITRAMHMAVTFGSYQYFRRAPKHARAKIRGLQEHKLPDGYPIDTHFKPTYDPWDQRLCVVPNGDLFRALTKGSAEMVTDTIDTFTETGIRLNSGQELTADIVVAATGLNLQMLGGASLSVDGEAVDFASGVAYKGLMFGRLPNMSITFGYVNASWTLKADLVSRYLVRLLGFMDERGYDEVLPVDPPADEELRPFIDLQAGYIQRMIDHLPKQGSHEPWKVHQNYLLDYRQLLHRPIADQGLRFFRRNPGRLNADDVDATQSGTQSSGDTTAALV